MPFQALVLVLYRGWSGRPSRPRIAYLVLDAVRLRTAVEVDVGCALGDHRLWNREAGERAAFGLKIGIPISLAPLPACWPRAAVVKNDR